ncbi:N-carbamoyl-L-amino-acid hydrolase [Isoptericola jiangsuensis]|uniref:N-carbamoyl-L-amino-acid hydrolase n=1 Tax=Isoptericola jiangsuensis TaxID=548579 RepID=A0A2A9ERX9_9MICO|nr:allantoate amidohydrolase [Isoptericola jiangsuensis]PFG41503.1 N-carbamoyl-L-amino-acid hydrolase [Isoptericola jiangsuensis]
MTDVALAHGRLAGLDEIVDVGRDAGRGGWSRHVWDAAETELRTWFVERAERLGLDVETDRNGNLWAWWGAPGPDAVVVGSHLDSVPGGGEMDGPLGVVSALDAVALLQAQGVRPTRPFAVVVFAEEEGSRFGIACLGSRLLTGSVSPDRVRALRDADGVTFAEAAAAHGTDPRHVGADPDRLARIGVFVELHVEQGRALADLDGPLAVASGILAHGRWRIDFTGQGNHAGATRMTDRRDPMVAAARGILAVRDAVRGDDRATIGRIEAVPGGTNVIPSRVTTWLDARSDLDDDTRDLVARITASATEAAAAEGCDARVTEESWSGRVVFDPALRDRLAAGLGGVPALPTGAGHDAGVLAGHVPTAMLFVRNPSGVSHAPEEHAELADCVEGVVALTTVLRGLL